MKPQRLIKEARALAHDIREKHLMEPTEETAAYLKSLRDQARDYGMLSEFNTIYLKERFSKLPNF